MIPPVASLEIEELRREAELFLDKYHLFGDPPIPIEEIVEMDLGLEIRPIRSLRRRFCVDAYLASDLQTIVVDEELMTKYSNRYRFTLAHEVGHYLLHPDQIRAVACETPDQWKAAVRSIGPTAYGKMEWQANKFAGCVLVPREHLLGCYQQAGRRAQERGIDLASLRDESLRYVTDWIARQFEVSEQVVQFQLELDGII